MSYRFFCIIGFALGVPSVFYCVCFLLQVLLFSARYVILLTNNKQYLGKCVAATLLFYCWASVFLLYGSRHVMLAYAAEAFFPGRDSNRCFRSGRAYCLTYISKINIVRDPSPEVTESIFCQIFTYISKINIFTVPSEGVIEHWFCPDLTFLSKMNIIEAQVKT